MNTALAISLPQYVFVAHLLATRYIHFIESDLNHDDDIYSRVDSVRNKQFVHAAEDMGCAPLAKIYRENDVEAINELANAGGEEFMIDRLQSEESDT